MTSSKTNRQDFFDMVRNQVKKEVRKKNITMDEFLREDFEIHPNSYNRKWKNQTVSLSDLLKIAEKLDKHLHVEISDNKDGTKQGDTTLVAQMQAQIDQQNRIIRTQQKLIDLLDDQKNKGYDNNR